MREGIGRDELRTGPQPPPPPPPSTSDKHAREVASVEAAYGKCVAFFDRSLFFKASVPGPQMARDRSQTISIRCKSHPRPLPTKIHILHVSHLPPSKCRGVFFNVFIDSNTFRTISGNLENVVLRRFVTNSVGFR